MAGGGGVIRKFQYCTDDSGAIVYFRALQGHSGRNLIDPSLQDNVVIPSNFVQHIYHVGCAFNFHSIINNGLIPGGQNSSKRQTVFFLPIDPRDKEHKDPDEIDLTAPRHAQHLQNAWKRHQDAVFWVDINLAIKKELTFYQTRSNAIFLQGTLPAYCIPKVVRLKTGEVLYDKVYMSPRSPPKISLKHEWKRELGSEHAQRPEVGQLSGSFQSNQPTLNPIREISGRPDITHDVIGVQDERKTSRSQEIDVNSFCEEPSSSERTGRPVETHVIQTRSSEDRKDFNVKQAHERTERPVITHDVINVSDSSQTRSAHESERFNVGEETLRKRTESSIAYYDVSRDSIMVNEADMDFRNPRLPHSVVKHAQSTSVRELIQKIENLPDRHALQQDLRQNQSFDSFSPESKQMLQDVGNIELCELLETEPKTQCTVCVSYRNIGILYCTCGHFLHNEKGTNQEFINYTMDLLSVPQYVIKKGRPHGHRYGKKPGDREYASGSITCASGSLSLASASWKQFSRLQKAFCFCEMLTLLLVPIDEAPASGSMLLAVCVLCGCVHE